MKNQNESQLLATDAPVVTTLTAEQAGQVSGGSLAISGLRGGCPTCTSGRLTTFANLASVVNPAPEI
jgi:uncharacterized protein (DUF983 family)